jgi:hypothetical protein
MSHRAAIVVAVVLTAAAVTLNAFVMGPAVILLNAGLIASLLAWLTTGAGRPCPQRLVLPLFLASIAVQGGGYAPGLATALINLPLGVALVVVLAGGKPHNPPNVNSDMPT